MTLAVGGRFNAARSYSLSPPPPLRGPPPPLAQGRLFVYGTSASLPDAQDAGCCKVPSQRADRGAHAARGFVGGAAGFATDLGANVRGFNAARGFVGGAARRNTSCSISMVFQCRTRLCGWCSPGERTRRGGL